MKRFARGLLSAVAAGLVLGAVSFLVVRHWVGTDDFRDRAQALAGAAVGLPVTIGRIDVDPWPVPGLALADVVIQTKPVLRAGRLEVRLVWRALLGGRVELATVLVRRADLPQAGIGQLMAEWKQRQKVAQPSVAGAAPAPPAEASGLVPRRIVLDAVTWRSAGGEALTVDADARLDDQGRLATGSLEILAGGFQGARTQLVRTQRGWDVRVDHAGGTVQGTVEQRVDEGAADEINLQGEFVIRDVDLSLLAAGAPAVRSGAGSRATAPPAGLTGRLDANTQLSARAGSTSALMAALQSRSTFTVRNAVVHGIDLLRAVQTVGLSRGGQTPLDTLTGQMTTAGKAVVFSKLVASSGLLSAKGEVSVAANRRLSGRMNVNLGAGMVGDSLGVPVQVGGTLDAPEITLTRAALVGAAIGTLVMPGVGTGAGASLGEKLSDKLKGIFSK